MPGNRQSKQPKKPSPKLLKIRSQIDALRMEEEDEVKRLNKQERNDDTRRKVLLGQALLKKAARDPRYKKFVYTLLDEDLRQQYNRDVFDVLMEEWGMPTLPRLASSASSSVTPAEMINETILEENMPEMESE